MVKNPQLAVGRHSRAGAGALQGSTEAAGAKSRGSRVEVAARLGSREAAIAPALLGIPLALQGPLDCLGHRVRLHQIPVDEGPLHRQGPPLHSSDLQGPDEEQGCPARRSSPQVLPAAPACPRGLLCWRRC
jgi:hypothetical protein